MKKRLPERCGGAGVWVGLPLLVLPSVDLKWQQIVLGLAAAGAILFWLVMHRRRSAALQRSREECARLEEQLRNILQHSREALFGYDLKQRRFDYLSPAGFSLTGRSAEEIEQMLKDDPLQDVHPDDREKLRRFMEQLRGRMKGREWLGMLEYRFRHRDGEYRMFSDHLHVRCDERGRFAYVSGCVRDVTATGRMEENLRILEKRFQEAHRMAGLGLLASGIAHDFNNLMTVVLGNTELALMEHSGPDSRVLDEIRKTALRAAELATQMLVYSGKTARKVESIHLSSVVREMGALLDVSISKKVRLEYCLAEELPPIRGDISQIRQVAMNLITNASDAIGDQPGVIAISIHETEIGPGDLPNAFPRGGVAPGRYVQLEVSDTGCGMDEQTAERIFEPLFTTKVSGRGLGLASVFNVVQRHNGAIDVQSRVGEGTVFRVFLPAEAQEDAPGEDQSAAPADAWRGFGCVLVADDEAAIRSIATALLERAGFTVVTAADGQEALDLFTQREEVTLLLMDHNMPRMDGQEAVLRIRHINPSVPVLFMSGYPREQIMKSFEDHPRIGYIKKPFQTGELMEQIRAVMER